MSQSQFDINSRAMLVVLTIRCWSGRVADTGAAAETLTNHNADASAGAFAKYLVNRPAIKAMHKIAGAARNEHYGLTLPWSDCGDRILSGTGYFEYTRRMREYTQQYENATRVFVSEYPQLMRDGMAALGSLGDYADYPTQAEIADKFSLSYKLRPIPTAGDFRCELTDADAANIRAQLDADIRASIDTAVQHVVDRIKSSVEHMRDRLLAYDRASISAEGKVKTVNPFRDSLVENIRELVEIMPSLNITGDKRIDDITAMMRADLTQFDADQLRMSDGTRMATAKSADDILAKMRSYGL